MYLVKPLLNNPRSIFSSIAIIIKIVIVIIIIVIKPRLLIINNLINLIITNIEL